MAATTCADHGTETRLTCATCEAPICPKCLVETKVGFKCPKHGRVTAAPLPKRKEPPADKDKDGSSDSRSNRRPPRSGGRLRIWPFFLIMLLFPLFGLALMALFAATADSTGIVRLSPLIAVGLILFGGAFYLASKVSR